VPAYPTPSNAREHTVADRTGARNERPAPRARAGEADGDGELREELRRIILEELHDLIGGERRG
jgi:hypothetical protein